MSLYLEQLSCIIIILFNINIDKHYRDDDYHHDYIL